MIYIIKFVYSFVLPPGLFILLLLGIVIWLWKKNRRPALVLLGVTLLMYFSMTSLVSDALIGGLERKYPQPDTLQGDVIVVLGGGASSGTPDIDGEGNLYGSAANRLITAVRLHNASGLPILFSGGQVFSDSGNEADIAKRQLLGLGVSEEDILTDNQSLNTEQNAVNTAAILQEKGLKRPVLVTSGFHMPRSMQHFKNVGLTAQAFPTDYIASAEFSLQPSKFTPSPGAISTTGTALKEYLGLLVAHLFH
ncbi:YdcF family protein [Paenibacillus sp. FSL E2-0201]|uniref:YdcF family protein n=1 Tax=Paenibacillus sp. FSL E2-0201 TaxID=2954726 RepID=UPI0030DAE37D